MARLGAMSAWPRSGKTWSRGSSFAIALPLAVLPFVANAADQAAAQACSANLSKDASTIYAKVAPTVTPVAAAAFQATGAEATSAMMARLRANACATCDGSLSPSGKCV